MTLAALPHLTAEELDQLVLAVANRTLPLRGAREHLESAVAQRELDRQLQILQSLDTAIREAASSIPETECSGARHHDEMTVHEDPDWDPAIWGDNPPELAGYCSRCHHRMIWAVGLQRWVDASPDHM